MGEHGNPTKLRSAAIHLGEVEGRIEQILPEETGVLKIRISALGAAGEVSGPLDLSEAELIQLLQKAIRAGILSHDFLKDLSSEFEI